MNTLGSKLRTTVAAVAVSVLAVVSVATAQAGGRDLAGQGVQTAQSQGYGDDDDGHRGRRSDDARPFIPLEFIISQINARTPGRLVGVRGPNGQGIYRIVWETTDGRVVTFVVDGRTGQIMR